MLSKHYRQLEMLAKRGLNLIKFIGIFPEIPRKLNLEKSIEINQETLVNPDSSSYVFELERDSLNTLVSSRRVICELYLLLTGKIQLLFKFLRRAGHALTFMSR